MKEALGGNCETIMLCCISPAERALRDTLNTLKYGNLARLIKNRPIVNEVFIRWIVDIFSRKALIYFFLGDFLADHASKISK